MFYIITLICGLLFGFGMVLSGMTDSVLVTAFLDVTGSWKSDLAFVMGGALSVFMPVYFLLIKPRIRPIVYEGVNKLTKQRSADKAPPIKPRNVDKPLLAGASIFGIGWGLVGICPGPAVASLAKGNLDIWLFFIAMLVGMALVNSIKTGQLNAYFK